MRKAYGDRAVGERLRRARRARGWSLAELAKRLGITPNNVWLWETGRYRIPPKRVEDLCQLLGVTPEWLLGKDAELEAARAESIVRRLERIAERMEAAMQPTPRDIPVVAYAACGKDVVQLDPDRDVLGHVPVPQDLPAQARAVRAVGESMWGFGVLPGDFLIVVPGPKPDTGLAVGIVRRPGQAAECKVVDLSGAAVWEWPRGSLQPQRVVPAAQEWEWLARVIWILRPEGSVLSMLGG